MSINERLIEIRKSLNMLQKDFAHSLGMAQTSLSTIETGNSPVRETLIVALCSKFNVNEQWLRTGEGEMFNNLEKNYNEFFNLYQQFDPTLQEFLNNVAKDLLDTQEKLKRE